jgi:hypothetical protein
MIRQIDKARFNIPASGHPGLHRELAWYATGDDAVLGVVILDVASETYAWAVLTEKVRGLCSDRYRHEACYGRGCGGGIARRDEVHPWVRNTERGLNEPGEDPPRRSCDRHYPRRPLQGLQALQAPAWTNGLSDGTG